MKLPYNMQVRYDNPHATAPLIMPVHLVCNVSDALLQANVYANSRLPKKWIKVEPAHGKAAVFCGSGPSLAEHIDEIAAHASRGAVIFAMNGAAKYLNDNGILADYQVILDARDRTVDLVGPAKGHLFASQVDPECFKRAPDAQVWHLQIGEVEDHFPDYPEPYALIGGGASVGNTALCLAYAMGYRDMTIYGYDSSHRGDFGHAFHQPQNASEPFCKVTFAGHEYTASLTMRLQAEKFQYTARALQDAGCTISVRGDGLLPAMWRTPMEGLSEAEKYSRIWSFQHYRDSSPGEACVPQFLDIASPRGRVIDFGCGTGRASLKMNEAGLDVILIDFTANSRDPEAMTLPFLQWDLADPIPYHAPFGFCADVMEHIAPENVDRVIHNIMASAPTVFFQISTVPDDLGVLIGHQLHLTVESRAWWAEKFRALGYRVPWNDEQETTALFLVQTDTARS